MPVLSPFTLSLQVLVAPVEGGRVGLGSSFHQEEQEPKRVSLPVSLVYLLVVNHVLSSNDMWSIVLVPVLDEKPCQQLLWDVEDSGGERQEGKGTVQQ